MLMGSAGVPSSVSVVLGKELSDARLAGGGAAGADPVVRLSPWLAAVGGAGGSDVTPTASAPWRGPLVGVPIPEMPMIQVFLLAVAREFSG